MPFVKLDTGILRSTLWLDKPGRDIFITALLLAEPQQLETTTEQINVRNLDGTGFMIPPGWYGFVAAAGPYLVHAAGVSEEEGFQALERLGSPEDESRSKDFGGRRLVRVDGGYLVLNYFKYRDHDYTAAERMRRLRARRNVTPNSDAVTANGRNEALSGDAVRANVTHSREQRQRAEYNQQPTDTAPAPKGEPAFGRFVEVFNAVYDRRVRKALLTKAEKDTLRGLVGAYGEAGACCLPLLAWAHDKQQGGGERLKQRVVSHLLRDGSRGTFQWSTLLERADSLLKDEWQYTRRVWKLARQFGLEQALEGFGAVEPPPQVATLPPMTAADLSELEEIKRRARADVEQEQRERYQ